MHPEQPSPVSRRDLLRGALAGTGAALIGQAAAAPDNGNKSVIGMPFEARDNVRMGLIGCGSRGSCLMLENCCYGENELLVLNMIRAGLFGDLLYGEGAYLHDLRKLLFEDQSEGLWRRFPHMQHNGNLYPTHGLGPVANYMGINRGD